MGIGHEARDPFGFCSAGSFGAYTSYARMIPPRWAGG